METIFEFNGMLLKLIRKRKSGINTYAICNSDGTEKGEECNSKGHVIRWNLILLRERVLKNWSLEKPIQLQIF